LEDVNGTLLDNIGLSNSVFSSRTSSSATTGGFVYGDGANLDAKYTLDGIDLASTTNTVTGAIPGVTFQLKGIQKSTDTPATLSVNVNTSQIQSNVQQFISAYNDLLSYVKQETSVDATTGTRQIFATDTMFTNLRFNLQNVFYSPVAGVDSSANMLFKIGIKQATDGSLSIADQATFGAAISSNAANVASLFNFNNGSSSGVAVRMKNLMDGFLASGGQMDTTSTSYTTQLSSLKTKIQTTSDNIDKQTADYQTKLANLQGILNDVTNQQTQINSIISAINSYSA
jgi:flagellar hook-associated protein 2